MAVSLTVLLGFQCILTGPVFNLPLCFFYCLEN